MAVHITVLSSLQLWSERRGRTSAYFFNLPRDRRRAFDAKVVYWIGLVLAFEAAIAVGAFLKLGGGGITPVYRIHPELAALPFYLVTLALWFFHRTREWWRERVLVLAVSALVIGWILYRFVDREPANVHNGFLVPRPGGLKLQCAMAAMLLTAAAALIWRTRSTLFKTDETIQ